MTKGPASVRREHQEIETVRHSEPISSALLLTAIAVVWVLGGHGVVFASWVAGPPDDAPPSTAPATTAEVKADDKSGDDKVAPTLVHQLRIEIVQDETGETYRVIVDGRAVDQAAASYLFNLIRGFEGIPTPVNPMGRGFGRGRGPGRPSGGRDLGRQRLEKEIQRLDADIVNDDGRAEPLFLDPSFADRVNPPTVEAGAAADQRANAPEAAQQPPGDARGPVFMRSTRLQQRSPLSLEQINQVMQLIADFDPQRHAELVRIQEVNNELFVGEIRREAFRRALDLELQSNDPEGYQLRLDDHSAQRRTLNLQIRYQQAQTRPDDGELQSIETQLRDLVGEHFDIRQKIREHELDQLEDQLAGLRVRLERRLAQRDQLIQRRVERLLSLDPIEDF